MLSELSLLDGAVDCVYVGQYLLLSAVDGQRVYEVAKVDREKRKVWGYWKEDMPVDGWWKLNDRPAIHPVFSNKRAD